jgi:hypothetical protein
MKVTGKPRDPLRWCLTLSGRRVHVTVPVSHHSLTLCRQVVYKQVKVEEVRGRTICQLCVDQAGGDL